MSDIKDDNGVEPVEPESGETTTEGTDAPAKPRPRPDHHTDPFHSTN